MAAQQYDLVSRDKTGDSWVKALRKQTMEKRMALARLLVVFIEALAISWALLYLGEVLRVAVGARGRWLRIGDRAV